MIYTEKQQELLKVFKNDKLKRINILHGSVRSGKTWISLVLWAFWVAKMPRDKSYLMVAKTLTSLKRNCLDLLEQLIGKDNFTYSASQKEGRLFGRKIYLEGVNDVRAETKIRGMTLQGAYCDEVTLFTEDFFAMLLSRLSEHGAKLICTTNPDSPYHWLKTNYIDNDKIDNKYIMQFLIDDNTTLDEEYVRDIKNEYSGVFYERFILGKWVIAEGLIYDFFNPDIHCYSGNINCNEYYISIDYGTQNAYSMGLWGISYKEHCAYRIKEYYYSGRDEHKQKTDSDYYMELVQFAENYNIENIIIDPSAASFIAEINKHNRYDVLKGKNDVVEGIRKTATYLKAGKIKINIDCKNTISELHTYAWDKNIATDKPIKEHDHAMDDMRYFCYTILKSLEW